MTRRKAVCLGPSKAQAVIGKSAAGQPRAAQASGWSPPTSARLGLATRRASDVSGLDRPHDPQRWPQGPRPTCPTRPARRGTASLSTPRAPALATRAASDASGLGALHKAQLSPPAPALRGPAHVDVSDATGLPGCSPRGARRRGPGWPAWMLTTRPASLLSHVRPGWTR